jgi:hypothetical protein
MESGSRISTRVTFAESCSRLVKSAFYLRGVAARYLALRRNRRNFGFGLRPRVA